MIFENTIAQAVATLVAAANPQRIVLFWSYARGDADEGSDLDLLVVKGQVTNRRPGDAAAEPCAAAFAGAGGRAGGIGR